MPHFKRYLHAEIREMPRCVYVCAHMAWYTGYPLYVAFGDGILPYLLHGSEVPLGLGGGGAARADACYDWHKAVYTCSQFAPIRY